MGRHQETISELGIALKSSTLHDHPLTRAGKRAGALKMLDQVENAPRKTFGATLVHTGLGEKGEALLPANIQFFSTARQRLAAK
jgi:hypothetical protein